MATAKSKTSKRKATTAQRTTPKNVDYYPNRMTVAISVLAAVTLMLLALIVVTNELT